MGGSPRPWMPTLRAALGAVVAGGLLLAGHAAVGAPRTSRTAVRWEAAARTGDAPGGGTDLDTFLARHGRGDRVVVRLRRVDGAESDAPFVVTVRGAGRDGRDVVRRTRRRSLLLRLRFRDEGTAAVTVEGAPAAAPPATPAGEPVASADYTVTLHTPGADGAEDRPADGGPLDSPLVPGVDVEDPVTVWPDRDPPLPPSPPVPTDPEPVPEPPPPPPPFACVLSGTSTGATPFQVDDALDLYVDGVLVYTDGHNGSGTREPVRFQAHDGSEVRVVCRDWYGIRAWVSDLYILVEGGSPVLVTHLLDLGWGRPLYPPNDGLFFDRTVTLRAPVP